MKIRELLAQKEAKKKEARALNTLAETETRDFTAEEQKRWDDLQTEIAALDKRIERAQSLGDDEPAAPSGAIKPVPAVIRNRGDNFGNALQAFVREGDISGLRHMQVGANEIEIRASNATDMNIGTAADGGDLVPVGFYNEIIAKRSEMSLPERLGVRKIPGVGTTVDVPYDNEADGEFVSTAETVAFDLDAPALAKRSMTLVKYSKKILISYELLQDTPTALEAFLADWVARGQAKTLNSLLLTEVATTGTAYKTTAANNAIVLGELEATALNDTVGDYLDDSGSVAWVMRPSVYSTINQIVGNPKYYAPAPSGAGFGGREVLGYPVYFSNKAAAIATTAKVAYFGNWNFVGWRESPGFTLLRDPYSAAGTGQTIMWMYFRTVFKQLQADAVGYMKMKT